MSSNSNPVGGTLAVEVEILREKVSSLRRVGQKMESLMEELEQVSRSLAEARGAERTQRLARHRDLRAEAEKQRWYLIVQREAMGLYNHDDIYELYRLPAPLER